MSSTLFSAAETQAIQGQWKMRSDQLEQQRLAPYADLLFRLIRGEAQRNKEVILESLLSKAASAETRDEVRVPIWFYYRTYYFENLEAKKQRLRALDEHDRIFAEEEEYMFQRSIQKNGWDWKIATEKEESFEEDGEVHQVRNYGLSPVRIDRIFRKTDLLQRINALFGTDYKVFLDWKNVEGTGEEERITVQRCEILVSPNLGSKMPQELSQKVSRCFSNEPHRKTYTLAENETLILQKGIRDKAI